MTAISEHSPGLLTVDLPQHGLRAGDRGVIVFVYDEGKGYEVEFFTPEGKTIDIVYVDGKHIRPVKEPAPAAP